MSVRSWPRRLAGAFVCGAVGVGLVGWAFASGTLAWNASWLESRPVPGTWRPLRPKPTEPPSTYPVVPVQPGAPPARYLQPVYALPSDAEPVPGRSEAILHEIGEVTAWFRSELGGAYPRYAPDGQAPSVITVELPWPGHELATVKQRLDDLSTWLHFLGRIEPQAIPVIYVESTTDNEACAWAQVAPDLLTLLPDHHLTPEQIVIFRAELERFKPLDHIVIPVQRCPEEHPSPQSRWPGGGTDLLAHETTHALGAVDSAAPHHVERGHTSDDPHDILYVGPERGSVDRYVIDAGHDDYYRHGRPDMVDIAVSELLVHPPGS
jgi:hypothetical protein